MIKLKCECVACKSRIEDEFLRIVLNPKNGVWPRVI